MVCDAERKNKQKKINVDYFSNGIGALSLLSGLEPIHINSLTTEKQTTKFSSANFQKKLSPNCIILRIQTVEGKQCRS